MNKKIAVISYHTCPLSDEQTGDNRWVGGLNIYVMELSRALVKKGFIIDIFTRSQDKNCPKIVEVEPNLRVIHLPAGSEENLSKKTLVNYIPEFVSNMEQFLQIENLTYDVFSCHYYLSGLVGLELKEKNGIPFMITFHTLGFMKNLVARGDEDKEDLERIKSELLLAKNADHVIATSEADAEYIQTLYNCPLEKISILIPGVNNELFKPMDKNEAKRKINADIDHKLILFVGRIDPVKGLDVLLYAIKILLEKNPLMKVCMWIVGADMPNEPENWQGELQKLEEIRKILHISTAVKFVGRKHQKELPYYYNAAEITIMPSNYESFGISALESMACGVPVIATDVMGVSKLFDNKHSSLITSAYNPLLLADKIKNLLMDEAEYQKVSRDVYQTVQDLGWDKVADRFAEIITWF